MSRIYDNWERLVAATLRREELRLIALRTPSDLSSTSASPSVPASPSYRVPSFSFTGTWEKDFYPFTYGQILQATDGLAASNSMEHSNSGNLFYGVLEDRTRVIVKKVDVEFFLREIEIHRKDSHSRLVPLRGYGRESANCFLVYKYMSNRDLSSYLREGFFLDDGRQPPSRDWKMRLKIAIGVAESLSYLRNECDPPRFHRKIHASSIFLDDNFEVRLGGLSYLSTEMELHHILLSDRVQLPKGFERSTHGVEIEWKVVGMKTESSKDNYESVEDMEDCWQCYGMFRLMLWHWAVCESCGRKSWNQTLKVVGLVFYLKRKQSRKRSGGS